MSHLRLSELRVALCPDRLIVAKYGRGPRRRLKGSAIHSVATEPVEELAKLADQSRLSVVLSNHFVRYTVLPWSSALASESEWKALAEHSFFSTYGDAARSWDIRVCTTGRRNTAVGCAVDRRLIESIRRIPNVASLQPHIMAAFNACRSHLPGPSLWFVLQERGRLTFALIFEGQWRLIRNRQAPPDWQDSLDELLDREAATCADAKTDWVVACCEDEHPRRTERYRIVDLALPPNADPALRPFRMAVA